MNKIITSRNYADMKAHAGYLAERKALTEKVNYWEAKAAKYKGQVHIATAAKFRAQLDAL